MIHNVPLPDKWPFLPIFQQSEVSRERTLAETWFDRHDIARQSFCGVDGTGDVCMEPSSELSSHTSVATSSLFMPLHQLYHLSCDEDRADTYIRQY